MLDPGNFSAIGNRYIPSLFGNNNIDILPTFVDPSPGTLDYHLMPGSSGIDIADWNPTICSNGCVDYDGDTRPQGAGFDIGADELIP